MEQTGADAAHHYMLVRGLDQLVRVHGCRGVNENEAAGARWASSDGVAFVFSDADPDHIAPLNRFGSPPADLYALPFFRWAIVDVGYNSLLYSNVAHAGEHRGLVALLREAPGPWSPAPRVLRAAATSIGAAFRAAWEAEVALAPPPGALDIDLAGRLTGDPALLDWAHHHDLVSWVSPRLRSLGGSTPFGQHAVQTAPGSFMRVMPHVAGGASISFERVRPMALPPMLTALSPVLRRVASLAAAGATIAEIAQATGRSPDTVKESVAKVYERLGVSSRAELATVAGRFLL